MTAEMAIPGKEECANGKTPGVSEKLKELRSELQKVLEARE